MTKQPDPEQTKKADLSPQRMRAVLPEVMRVIADLEEIDVRTIQERGERRFEILEEKIEALLVGIFGNDSVEYDRFRVETLDTARVHMMYEIPLYEIREGYQRGIEHAISNLRAVIELFGERALKLDDSLHVTASTGFEDFPIHPAIKAAAREHYRDGHFAVAVREACKALETLVKTKSEKHDLSGAELMQVVFGTENPVLKLSDLNDAAGECKQQGILFLFSGAMIALQSQQLLMGIQKDPEKALECLAFLSFLAKFLDGLRKR